MAADPIPDDAVIFHDCQSAVIDAYAGRVYIVLALQLLEVQTGAPRIGAEETIRASWRTSGQRRAARTAVSPATGSKQIVQRERLAPCILFEGLPGQASDDLRFSAKRFFQASSSAKAARIWDAIASCSSRGRELTFSKAFSKSVDMPLSLSANFSDRQLGNFGTRKRGCLWLYTATDRTEEVYLPTTGRYSDFLDALWRGRNPSRLAGTLWAE